MNTIKKILFVCLVGIFVLGGLSPTTLAAGNENNAGLNGAFDPNNLPENVTASEVMTYDEMITTMAKDMDITKEEAIKIAPAKDKSVRQSTLTSDSSNAVAAAATYRTFTVYLQEFNNSYDGYYQPSLRFYCETSESGSFHGIVKIINTTLNRDWFAEVKTFTGTVFVYLEHAGKIHYIVNGDWYDISTGQSFSGGASITIGKSITINFSSSKSNYFGYMDEARDFFW
ncbi:hypothetical protein MHH33_12830 [Paenisporosarcina sp. FSL H8-0542]|uniref:hypothetical protein n=1 Tax=Paenisporosarcina sp. FSL H8-0542 TaxID=2921401 RepID=UPI00315B24ED